ncbi:RING/U-box superfamily protein, putative isoform 1 [Quillaja saponaria]|uniref:RING/U-box superfamily protein, putative isoform 1 n=1 Tax=Quillaja saponaria TaxID=32244 RepID=A0AAD7PQI4_QUISA|nr:RING/U-box superfamily protein, putative isoform 1 [Quillaja saponaria]
MTRRFSGITKVALIRCKEAIPFWVFATICSTMIEVLIRVLNKVLLAAILCILALGGSITGTVVGAIKGQTTEMGILDGAGRGAVTGAIAAIEMMDTTVDDESLTKVALLGSLLNLNIGEVFMEWVCPVVAKAYQWHVSMLEATYIFEISDLYDIKGVNGLSQNLIQKLPFHEFNSSKMFNAFDESCCSICFQDFKNEDLVRVLPKCGHFFHLNCIDKWLIRQGSCPICRTYVSNCIHDL